MTSALACVCVCVVRVCGLECVWLGVCVVFVCVGCVRLGFVCVVSVCVSFVCVVLAGVLLCASKLRHRRSGQRVGGVSTSGVWTLHSACTQPYERELAVTDLAREESFEAAATAWDAATSRKQFATAATVGRNDAATSSFTLKNNPRKAIKYPVHNFHDV